MMIKGKDQPEVAVNEESDFIHRRGWLVVLVPLLGVGNTGLLELLISL